MFVSLWRLLRVDGFENERDRDRERGSDLTESGLGCFASVRARERSARQSSHVPFVILTRLTALISERNNRVPREHEGAGRMSAGRESMRGDPLVDWYHNSHSAAAGVAWKQRTLPLCTWMLQHMASDIVFLRSLTFAQHGQNSVCGLPLAHFVHTKLLKLSSRNQKKVLRCCAPVACLLLCPPVVRLANQHGAVTHAGSTKRDNLSGRVLRRVPHTNHIDNQDIPMVRVLQNQERPGKNNKVVSVIATIPERRRFTYRSVSLE